MIIRNKIRFDMSGYADYALSKSDNAKIGTSLGNPVMSRLWFWIAGRLMVEIKDAD